MLGTRAMQENSQNISQQEEQAYEKVALELAENIRKEGLWAKALSVCEGDEAKCKALYISYRAKQILDELQPQSDPSQSPTLSSIPATNQKTILYSLTGVALVGLLGFFLFFNSSQNLIDGRYLINNDGTVTDIHTKLTWQRCSVGQTWTGETCAGEASSFKWDDAMQLAKDGWRLPTVDELDTLVFCSSGQRKPSVRLNGRYVRETDGQCQGDYSIPVINQLVFPNTNQPAFPNRPTDYSQSGFWSSSPDARNSAGAWLVDFGYGGVSYGFKSYGAQVRLVRAGQ